MLDQESLAPLRTWKVSERQKTLRLDAFVRQCVPYLSLRQIQKAIGADFFWINHRPGKKGDRLSSGDLVSFRGPADLLSPAPLPAQDLRVPILYEDEYVLVVNKPAGMPTHGFSGKDSGTLANFLVAQHSVLRQIGRNRWQPGLVHRLDRETSGVLLVAKTQEAFKRLRLQFQAGSVEKKYWALVWGKTQREGVIAYSLVRDRGDRRKMKAVVHRERKRPSLKEWPAVTRFRALSHRHELSLLEVQIETGVTHQIRVHLAAIGHPVVGDSLYGKDRSDPLGLTRHFLHAHHVRFEHPGTRKQMVVESPLPDELKQVLNHLGMAL